MDDKPDIEFGPLANGCFAGCGSGCLGVIVILILISMTGVEVAHLTPDTVPGWTKFVGFIFGLAAHVLSGYVTARCASEGKKFHALILGIIAMVLGVLVFVSPDRNSAADTYIFTWLLIIPLTLWGANIAIAQDEKHDQ